MMWKWNVVHECDDDNGNPTEWSCRELESTYGYVWIDELENGYGVITEEHQIMGYDYIFVGKSLEVAKRWVQKNLSNDKEIYIPDKNMT